MGAEVTTSGLRAGGFWAHRARSLVLAQLERLERGVLEVREGDAVLVFGAADPVEPLEAVLEVHDPRFWERAAWGGSIGAGEAFCEGLWSSPDLTALARVFARNLTALDRIDGRFGRLVKPLRRGLHRLRNNSRSGSRRNIAAHYDTGNEFFSTFLDPTLTYSCAIFPEEHSTLEEAQRHKLDTICRRLELASGDRLVEIGTGWGALAVHAARHYGCRVTTTTISNRQLEYSRAMVRREGLDDWVDVVQLDYRDLPEAALGPFDKLVSIEMIEAVGHRYLPAYFETIARLLAPGGRALIQAITIPDDRYELYRREVDFIQHAIFPGALLPSVRRMRDCIARTGALTLLHLHDISRHYATTLHAWRDRFLDRESEIATLGLDAFERRKWRYYFDYCAGGFLERTIGDVQLLLEAESPATGAAG